MKVNIYNNINNYPKSAKDKQRDNYSLMQATSQQNFKGSGIAGVAKNFVEHDFIQRQLQSGWFNKFLKSASENPGLFEAFIALGITCTARPLTIMATPGAEREDKKYASAQSIASGLTGLAFVYSLFDPIKQGVDNIVVGVNKENVTKSFKEFYKKPENKDLIQKLVARKVIPTAEEFNKNVASGDAFGYLKKYLKTSGAMTEISNALSSGNEAQRKEWVTLANEYSSRLKNIFEKNKMNGIVKEKQYLVHKSLEFLKEGGYKLIESKGAENTKYLFNFTSKIIFFPLTAGIMIWSIPKIMRVIFPNHKKSKGKKSLHAKTQNMQKVNLNSGKLNTMSANFESSSLIKKSTFEKFQKKPASSVQQVSFSGLGSSLSNMYNKAYKNPLAHVFEWLFKKITFTKTYAKKMENLMEKANHTKYDLTVPARDKDGEIMSKGLLNPYISNLPNIAAVFGSCLYIVNTLRNKEIEPERKPALCTNMALVAVFSVLASKTLEKKIAEPFFNVLKEKHTDLIGKKLNYDHLAAWNRAQQLLSATFAFRYLGPVLATPAADKLVKLFAPKKTIQKQDVKKA